MNLEYNLKRLQSGNILRVKNVLIVKDFILRDPFLNYLTWCAIIHFYVVLSYHATNYCIFILTNCVKSCLSIVSWWGNIFLVCATNGKLSNLGTWISMELSRLLESFSYSLVLMVLWRNGWMIEEVSPIININSSNWGALVS
jgi:hypothetical protein